MNTAPSFRVLAHAYLDWLERVRDAKPSTLLDHGYLLAEPGTPHRRGPGKHPGHIMKAFGDRPADEIHTRDVNTLLEKIAAAGVAPRTVERPTDFRGTLRVPLTGASSPNGPGWTTTPQKRSKRSPAHWPTGLHRDRDRPATRR